MRRIEVGSTHRQATHMCLLHVAYVKLRVQHEDELQGNTKEASATRLCEWQRTMKRAIRINEHETHQRTVAMVYWSSMKRDTVPRRRCMRVALLVWCDHCVAIVRRAVNRHCYELMLIWILPDAAKRYHRSANWVQFSRKRRVSHCSLCLQHTQFETHRNKKRKHRLSVVLSTTK